MPVIKSAQKKLKQDKKKTKRNKDFSDRLKQALKKAKKAPSQKLIREAQILVDKAVKNKLIHKNKAARLKSGMIKLIKKPIKSTMPQKPPKTPKNKAKTS